jgi:hypothetical protein
LIQTYIHPFKQTDLWRHDLDDFVQKAELANDVVHGRATSAHHALQQLRPSTHGEHQQEQQQHSEQKQEDDGGADLATLALGGTETNRGSAQGSISLLAPQLFENHLRGTEGAGE